MKKFYVICGLMFIALAFSMCNKTNEFPESGYDDRLSGGAATTLDATSKAFGEMVDGLDARDETVHQIGDQTFGQTFVAPPAIKFTGLGPIYNNVSCINCHRNDGEGIPTAGFSNSGLLFRISIPGTDIHGGPNPAPGFGVQLQDKAVIGAQPEAQINITYTDVVVTYPDGSTVILHKPDYTVENPYTTLPSNYFLSPRLAPPMVGLGLLEKIPESTILSFQDPHDANGDGITGKANYVFDSVDKKVEIGRFGWKANSATLLMQIASAYLQDMGITSYALTKESAYGQPQMNVVHGDVYPELADSLLNFVTYYVKTLAVPARRNVTDPDVKAGEQLFTQINCAKCHIPTIQTGTDLTLPQISNQRIHPYTDLLLHDMGDGLADGRQDFLATGTEWRTAPLWGIGLFSITNGTPYYLHDGRAHSLEEAILWHGGEAEKAKDNFMSLSKTDRDKLLKFLNSL
jgi:CxxC motif-containing protein (DUF1111 family)